MPSLRTSPVFKDFLTYSVGAIFLRGVSFFLIPVYTRYLPPAEYGLLDLITTFSGTLELVFSLGLLQVLQMDYYKKEGEEQERFIRRILRGYTLVSSGLYLLSGIVVFFLHRQHFTGVRLLLVYAAMFTSFLNFYLSITNVVLRFRERAKVFTVLQFCLGAGSLLLNVIFVVLFRMGIEGILLSNLITLLIAFGFYLLFLGSIGKEYHFRPDWKEIRNTIASGIIFVPGMLAFWGMNSVSRWVLLDVSDLREVGFYSMALRFSSLLEPLVIQPFLNAYNPRLFRSFAEGDYRHLKGRTVALILLAGVLVGPLLAVVARWMVDAAYHPAIVLIPVLVIAAAFSLIAQTAILLIVFRRKVHLSLLAMLTGFAVSVLANYFLAIRYGGIGAACGTAIGNLAWMSIVVFLRRREERIAAIGI